MYYPLVLGEIYVPKGSRRGLPPGIAGIDNSTMPKFLAALCPNSYSQYALQYYGQLIEENVIFFFE